MKLPVGTRIVMYAKPRRRRWWQFWRSAKPVLTEFVVEEFATTDVFGGDRSLPVLVIEDWRSADRYRRVTDLQHRRQAKRAAA